MLYIRREKNIEKSYVIYALKIRFPLLNRKNMLMPATLTKYAAEVIRKIMIYIALSICINKVKSFYINVNRICTNQSLLIIDELSVIYFKLLATIDKQLQNT